MGKDAEVPDGLSRELASEEPSTLTDFPADVDGSGIGHDEREAPKPPGITTSVAAWGSLCGSG